MMRTSLSVLLAVVALVAIPTRSAMQSQSVLPAEIAVAAANGPVRVIVRLNVPALAENVLPDTAAVGAQRAMIAVAQERALQSLPGLAEGLTRFQTMAAFAVTTDREGLERLAQLPLVTGITFDGLSRRQLLDSATMVHAHVLWTRGTEASGWSVAVLDDGVEKSHPFFTSRVVSEACYSTTSPSMGASSLCPGGASASTAPESGVNCSIDCDHGTHVAGIAAGRGGLISGVARAASIVSIQVFTRIDGAGCSPKPSPCITAFDSNIISGLERVLAIAGPENTARIGAVNLSLGGEQYSAACDDVNPLFTQAIENLRAIGIPTIVASGNDGYISALSFPACISRAISVGAVTMADSVWPLSNASHLLHLLAPGNQILSAALGGGFRRTSGTSMAAPHVAGAWTLLKSTNPTASVDAVLQALQLTGVPVTDSATGQIYRRIALGSAEGSMGPAGSPTALNVAVTGSIVTASWANPFNGSVPVGFHVEIREATTRATIAVVNVGTNRSFLTTLQNGRYLMRIRSITAEGSGAASSDVAFTVGPQDATVPPMAPANLRAEVNGQNVTLTWNFAQESAPVTSYIVEAGSLPGLTNFGTFETSSSALGVTVSNVQRGLYFVRLRARNAYGVSGPSNEVTVTITGTGCVLPLPPTGLNATVVGSLVTLNWNPPAVAGTIRAYLVEVGSAPGLFDIVTMAGPATVLSASASPGVYYVRVRAQSTCGLTGPSNEVTVVVP